MSRVDELFLNLEMVDEGFWQPREAKHAGSGREAISYPEGDHDVCFDLEAESPWFLHRNRVIGWVAKKHFGYRDVLDVGGGNGAVAYYLESVGFRSLLVEPGPQGARNAKKRGVRDVIWAQLSDLKPSSVLKIDVGLFDVVEHIKDDVGFMKSIGELISQESSVAITVPAYQALWSDRDVEAGHFRRYNLGSLTTMLEAAGFQVVYATYFFALLAPLMHVVSWLKRISGARSKPESSSENLKSKHRGQHQLLKVLGICFWLERQVLKMCRLPFGASIVVVARKKPRL